MIEQEDKDLIRRELMEERYREEQEEMQLHNDVEYALEQLADDKLIDMYDDLTMISSNMNRYGWDVSISELIDRLKEI